jgi:1-aminocyclopropane-1-carboxylate deaminase/D-cysteine desulfhydrase-like pyridoxal-dependent ACC family enzyme
VGSLGYVEAFGEIQSQAAGLGLKVDAIVHASSSCGTQAGLIAGASIHNSDTKIMGVNVYRKSGGDIAAAAHALALETIKLSGGALGDISERVHVIDGYQGEAYGQPTHAMREAVLMAAQTEGLLLDPVYSGKAMAALISHVGKGKLCREQTVVFLHTGGSAGLFGYREIVNEN